LTDYRWSKATDQKEWDDFIMKNGGTICHSWTWRLYLQDSGGSTIYVICRNRGGEVIAACPFAVVKKSRFVSTLDSLPFTSAGPVVSNKVNDLAMLLTSLTKVNLGSALIPTPTSMMIRIDQPGIVKQALGLGWGYTIHEGDFLLDFQKNGPETIWEQILRKDERNELRYYIGTSSFRLAGSEKDYDAFIDLYKKSMVRRGYSERVRQISSMRRCFGGSFNISLLESEDTLMAGLSFLCSERESTVRLDKIGYAPIKNSRSPYFYMLWMMVKWTYERGYRYLRLGTTPADESHPLHRIKRKFGGTFIPEYDFRVPISNRSLSALRALHRVALRTRRE
jgi:hypothetical protein